MVRVTRFSFDDGMSINDLIAQDPFDEEDDDFDDLDGFRAEERYPVKNPSPPRPPAKRQKPHDRRADRRHLAGADWAKPATGKECRAPEPRAG